MEYVQRAVYGPEHELSYMMHDTVHLSNNDMTMCGKQVNEMWFTVKERPVSCRACKKAVRDIKQ